MRFKDIQTFSVDELVLDEANYRFQKAVNQKECIKKIYETNPGYFRGLMDSIAQDALGEPLLVYQTPQGNIVADGNRRLSVLKVLLDDDFAPSDAIKNYAGRLRSEHSIDFDSIQAQVSTDKKLVSRTVYERHSSGKTGTTRIPWNAYAAARFGFDERIGDHKEWRIMALLSRVEDNKPAIVEFIDSSEFSYEVFRRLVRSAIKNKVISENIFSVKGEKIKQTARADLVRDAIVKCYNFLLAMKKRVISLSRGENGIYADKENLDLFVSEFGLSPDNKELEEIKQRAEENKKNKAHDECTEGPPESTDDSERQKNNADSNNGFHDGDETDSGQNLGSSQGSSKSNNKPREAGLTKSDAVLSKLNQLRSKKLSSLYKSMCTVSLMEHPALQYVGAWSFLEVLSKLAGNVKSNSTSTPDFPSFFRQKMKSYKSIDVPTATDCGNILDIISKYGNATKHSTLSTAINAIQLRHDFSVIEPLLLEALDEAISKHG